MKKTLSLALTLVALLGVSVGLSGCASDPTDEPVTTKMNTANDSPAAQNADAAPTGPMPGAKGGG